MQFISEACCHTIWGFLFVVFIGKLMWQKTSKWLNIKTANIKYIHIKERILENKIKAPQKTNKIVS